MQRDLSVNFYRRVILFINLQLLRQQLKQRDRAFNSLIAKLKQPYNTDLGTKKNNGLLLTKIKGTVNDDRARTAILLSNNYAEQAALQKMFRQKNKEGSTQTSHAACLG